LLSCGRLGEKKGIRPAEPIRPTEPIRPVKQIRPAEPMHQKPHYGPMAHNTLPVDVINS